MSVFQATDADFESALRSHERTIVKYYTDWCGACQLISPFFRQLANDPRFQEVQFLEVNSEENQLARKKAGVYHLPYFALFQKEELVQGITAKRGEAIVELLSQFA